MAQLVIDDNKKFIFIHIHKNGGTSVYNALKNKNIQKISTLSAMKVRNKYPSKFSDYYTFSIIRNPWSRFLSYYMFLRQWNYTDDRINDNVWKFEGGDPREMDFSDWLVNTKFWHNQFPKQKNKPAQEISQFDWITDENDDIIIDSIFDLEHIDRDWKIVCDIIGIKYSPLPIFNSTKHKHYREYYNDCAKKHVERVAAREIEFFGYKF